MKEEMRVAGTEAGRNPALGYNARVSLGRVNRCAVAWQLCRQFAPDGHASCESSVVAVVSNSIALSACISVTQPRLASRVNTTSRRAIVTRFMGISCRSVQGGRNKGLIGRAPDVRVSLCNSFIINEINLSFRKLFGPWNGYCVSPQEVLRRCAVRT